MSQVFRVGDLARQMGVTVEELLFKLRSIGVDVSSPDDSLDLATVRAIITGETLQHRPREVIVRREATATEEKKKPQAPAAGVKRRRPTRRISAMDEELPDQVPNLAGLTVPASVVKPAPPAKAAEEIEAPAAKTKDVEAPPLPPEEVPAPKPVAAAPVAETVVASAEEAAPAVEEAPAAPKKRTRKTAKPAAEEAPAAEVPAPEPAREAAPPVPTPARGARTPLESQLRELSDDEIRQRIIAARQAPAAAKKPEKAAPAGRGKASKKAKAAADADEIRDLLAKFEESKVRAKSDAAATPTAPVVSTGRGRTHRPKRERGEAPVVVRTPTVQFKDGEKPAGPIYLSEAATVRELAEKLNVLVKDLMSLLISKKILVTANQTLPREIAEQLCEELGVEAMVVSFEEEIDLQQEETAELAGKPEPRPPVVTVMGHVDHGKTTLLDAIRSTRVAAGEAGGITQHIGASRVVHNGKPIVFIDTPGHEAFTQMRARGAKVTDMVVLVVAADDGVMPQTLEAINHARAARVPIIVAINKIDKGNANPDRVRQELSSHGVSLEGWGGDIPVVEVSALKQTGINDVLEVILLLAEMHDFKAVAQGMARGTILEARKEKGRGVVATVLVEQGTLAQGDCFFSGSTYGRVRAMVDVGRKPVRQAGPSDAVEVMGFEDIPEAGDTFQVVENEARAREVAGYRQSKAREEQMASGRKVSLEGLMEKIKSEEVKDLNVVLKADVQGSVEVLRDTLLKLSTEEVATNVIHASVGAINVNDILLASASQAVVIGFNVRPDRSAKELAERERVDVRMYSVIYNLMEEIQKAMTGLLAPTFREEELGRAEVRDTFRISKVGTIAGCMVLEGSIVRSAKARLLRDNVLVWEGGLSSLKRFKEDVSEVKHGFECGIGLERFHDVKVGDVIEVYRTVEVAREM